MSSLNDFLQKWRLTSLSINAVFLKAKISFKDADRSAAWEMYIELLTRVSTQYLEPDAGAEEAALNSLFDLFKITRKVIKKNGADCINFTKIAVVVLNQIIRPFTAKWHRLSLEGAFEDPKQCLLFREEMASLQDIMRKYTSSLADIAEIEDLTDMELII